jgi:hypothetical protein
MMGLHIPLGILIKKIPSQARRMITLLPSIKQRIASQTIVSNILAEFYYSCLRLYKEKERDESSHER